LIHLLEERKQAAFVWRSGSNNEILILSTASAIKDADGQVMGALVMEKTNAAILALQDQTLEILLLISLVLFFSTGIILLIYSGNLVNRVLHLKQSIEKVMSQEGKLKQEFSYIHQHDEIGQLSRSFATLFQQLNRYTGYLESMVSKLSHELGTPLSIIKSSLENMQIQGVSDDNKIFLQRAIEGSQRLNLMLTRMGEASRLEQALQSSQKVMTEINQLLTQYIGGIQVAHPEMEFVLKLPATSIYGIVCPELTAQLLDKLINNAISFHQPQSSILITLSENSKKSTYNIDIFNQGKHIPKKIENSLFDSMVSYRKKTGQAHRSEVNLGLGLHVSKLICQYHHGKLNFINREKEYRPGLNFVLISVNLFCPSM